MKTLYRWWMRLSCRMSEEEAASHGDYRTAHYWLRRGEQYR